MKVKRGIDVLLNSNFKSLENKTVGVVIHGPSVSFDDFHPWFFKLLENKKIRLKAIFGPQHGIYGQTQDNMIEWQGGYDKKWNIYIYSLYSNVRKPTPEMLKDIDVLLFDLQDVGARYYTYIHTLSYCMEACGENNVKLIVLDRPNPISGNKVEGNILELNFRSFVGLHPIPVRYGLTVGELAILIKEVFNVKCQLEVIKMQGWKRNMYFTDTGIPWILPSPNMPTPETALVYPGMCLLEATNISEGRGTTKPFEIFGAPFIDSFRLANYLNKLNLKGVKFRPLLFLPTFHKYSNQICGGIQIHITDKYSFKPYFTGIAIIKTIHDFYPEKFKFRPPPYEYEMEKLPFDILTGTNKIRNFIENNEKLSIIEEFLVEEKKKFLPLWKEFQLY